MTLNYGNYGIFLLMGNAGFIPSTVLRTLNGALHPQSQPFESSDRGNPEATAFKVCPAHGGSWVVISRVISKAPLKGSIRFRD